MPEPGAGQSPSAPPPASHQAGTLDAAVVRYAARLALSRGCRHEPYFVRDRAAEVARTGALALAAAPPALAASRPKRDVPAASPSRAPAHPKKTRGVAVQAALAAAAPPITADNYAAAALAAAANPHPPPA